MLIVDADERRDRVYSEETRLRRLRHRLPRADAAERSRSTRPLGMCVDCNGLGTRVEVDPDAGRARRRRCRSATARSRRGARALARGRGWTAASSTRSWRELGDRLDKPWSKLAEEAARAAPVRHRRQAAHGGVAGASPARASGRCSFEGVLPQLDAPLHARPASERCAHCYAQFFRDDACAPAAARACAPRARAVCVADKAHRRASARMTVDDARTRSSSALRARPAARAQIAGEVLKEIRAGSASCSTSGSTT